MGDDAAGGSTTEEAEALATVQTLLAANGLQPPADEIERLARLYPGLRRTVDRFHAVDTGDEVMAAVFRAEDDGVNQ